MLERLSALVASKGYKRLIKLLALLLLALGIACFYYYYLTSGFRALALAGVFDFAVTALLLASLSLVRRIGEYRLIEHELRTPRPGPQLATTSSRKASVL